MPEPVTKAPAEREQQAQIQTNVLQQQMRDQGFEVLTRADLNLPNHWAAYDRNTGDTRVFLENPRTGVSVEVDNEYQQRRVCDAVNRYHESQADFTMERMEFHGTVSEERSGGTEVVTSRERQLGRSAPETERVRPPMPTMPAPEQRIISGIMPSNLTFMAGEGYDRVGANVGVFYITPQTEEQRTAVNDLRNQIGRAPADAVADLIQRGIDEGLISGFSVKEPGGADVRYEPGRERQGMGIDAGMRTLERALEGYQRRQQ